MGVHSRLRQCECLNEFMAFVRRKASNIGLPRWLRHNRIIQESHMNVIFLKGDLES